MLTETCMCHQELSEPSSASTFLKQISGSFIPKYVWQLCLYSLFRAESTGSLILWWEPAWMHWAFKRSLCKVHFDSWGDEHWEGGENYWMCIEGRACLQRSQTFFLVPPAFRRRWHPCCLNRVNITDEAETQNSHLPTNLPLQSLQVVHWSKESSLALQDSSSRLYIHMCKPSTTYCIRWSLLACFLRNQTHGCNYQCSTCTVCKGTTSGPYEFIHCISKRDVPCENIL